MKEKKPIGRGSGAGIVVRCLLSVLLLLLNNPENMANEKNTKGCVSGDAEPKENPFYSAYGTPFSTVPFDRIEVSDYLPAL